MRNEHLRAHRRRRGWSQEDVALGLVAVGIEIGERQVGVTRGLVSRWERGVAMPRSPYPKLLCLLFEATAEDLGLVASSAPPPGRVRMDPPGIEDDVERRAFLRLAVTAPLGMAVPSMIQPKLSQGSLEAIASVVNEYRQEEDRIPAHHLLGPLLAHLEHLHRLVDEFGWSKELAVTAANTALLAAWLADDVGDPRLAGEHHRAAVAFAHRAGSSVLESYMAGCMSFWAAEIGQPDDATRYLSHALGLAPPAARARLALLEASVQARARDATGCLRSLGRAEKGIGLDNDPLWPEAFPFDEARVTRYRGGCAADLELADIALPALEQALLNAPSGLSKLRGRVLADLASTRVQAGEIEEACRHIGDAFEIGVGMAYTRLLGRVQDVRRAFPASWESTRLVRELDDKMISGFLGRT